MTQYATTITFEAGSTTTVTNFTITGESGAPVTINSSVPGTQFTLTKATGNVSSDYLIIQDSNATGGATWYAGANSSNVSNNTGWLFESPPAPPSTSVNGQFFVFF